MRAVHARLMATGLAMLQIRLLAPGTKQRKGQSEQRPEAQEWAEACGQEGQVTQRILVLLRAKRKRRGKLCGSGIVH